MEIRNALATHGYAQAQQAAPPTLGGDPTAPDPGTAFAEAIDGFSQTVARGEQAAQAAMTTGVDPHSLVTALAQTELAVQTAVTVRDRVVEAYQEILRMPV